MIVFANERAFLGFILLAFGLPLPYLRPNIHHDLRGLEPKMADYPSIELLARFRAGDERAAEELFPRFAERLIAVAKARLSAKLARRVGAEDVVQSAYRSF
jgi:hypothetical protein